MGAGELAALHALSLLIVICVVAGDSLALIEPKKRGARRTNLGVEFGGSGQVTDSGGLERALGGHGVEVTDSNALAHEATAALDCDRFTLIATRVPRRAQDGSF